ncbi:MAG: hypothetical protein SGJ23_02540 [Alphaproteobacteria bacterium]|nr:hypothetical protein [Alphaproteobacteria bacterium]
MRNFMIVGALASALALALAACGPKAETKPEEAPAASTAPASSSGVAALADPKGACAATATHTWTPKGATSGYTITGAAAGPTCNTGEAVITVRDAAGRVLLSNGGYDVGVMSNTVFSTAVSPESLKAAVADWVSSVHEEDATGQLPEWKAGAAQPTAGEFPFYPEEGMTQAQYAAIRAANKPMFCHVQGGESLACYAVDGDTLTKVGLQSFPG